MNDRKGTTATMTTPKRGMRSNRHYVSLPWRRAVAKMGDLKEKSKSQ